MNKKTLVLSGIVVIGLPAAWVHAISSYNLTDLGNLGGQSIARGLNDENQVVGYSILPNGDETAFLWQQSTGIQNLGALPGDDQSYALSINNAGQVTGGSQGPADVAGSGFLWQSNTGLIGIGPGGDFLVNPFGINGDGQMYGMSSLGGFIYSTTSGFTVAKVPGTTVHAVFALNQQGQMVVPNSSNDDVGMEFYSPGQGLIPIRNSVGWDVSVIAGMDEQGTVIGTIPTPITGNPQAFIWNQAGGMTVLTPDPNDSSWATGINDLGQVVGGASLDGQPFFPFLYENGTMYALMPYLNATAAGWTNLNLSAINDNGDIAGYGLYDGQEEAFLLTPTGTTTVPEPAAIPLVSGFCLLAFRRRRKG